jgi:hypothetical protein
MRHPIAEAFAALEASGFMDALTAHAAASAERDLTLVELTAAETALSALAAGHRDRVAAETRALAAHEAAGAAKEAFDTAEARLASYVSREPA